MAHLENLLARNMIRAILGHLNDAKIAVEVIVKLLSEAMRSGDMKKLMTAIGKSDG